MAKFLIKLTISVLIFSFLIWKAGPAETIASLARYKLIALVIINFTTVGGLLLGGTGVVLLGRTINSQLAFAEALKGFLASASLALFVPGRAGDLTLPFFWKRFMQPGESLSVVFIDKSITLFWILSIGSLGVYKIFNTIAGFVCAGIGLGAIAIIYLLISMPSTRLVISNLLPGPVINFLRGSMNGFREIGRQGKTAIMIVLLLTLVRVMVSGVGFWVSLWGLDTAPSLVYAILVIAMAQFTTIIPISVMGVGTVDVVCVYTLQLLGIDSSLVMAALIAGRIVTLFWLGLFFVRFNVYRKNKTDLKKIGTS
jgi:uncharacterized membrane protein YbhN (UPF0104 family)